MSSFIADLKNSWSNNTSGVAGVLLTIITGLLTLAGGVLLYYDLSASYYGWGYIVETDMNLPNSTPLALCVTALPTLVQLAWAMSKVAGHELGEHAGVNVLFWVMFAVDTALDLNFVVTGTTKSWIMSTIVVLGGFGLASEFLLAFMGSSFIGMVRSLISSPGLWNPNKQEGRPRSGRASSRPTTQSRQSSPRPRQPRQGKPPSAPRQGPRRDSPGNVFQGGPRE